MEAVHSRAVSLLGLIVGGNLSTATLKAPSLSDELEDLHQAGKNLRTLNSKASAAEWCFRSSLRTP